MLVDMKAMDREYGHAAWTPTIARQPTVPGVSTTLSNGFRERLLDYRVLEDLCYVLHRESEQHRPYDAPLPVMSWSSPVTPARGGVMSAAVWLQYSRNMPFDAKILWQSTHRLLLFLDVGVQSVFAEETGGT